MTLPRLYAFNEAWHTSPPLYHMVAAWLGYGKTSRVRMPSEEEATAAAYGMGGGMPIDDSEGPDGFDEVDDAN